MTYPPPQTRADVLTAHLARMARAGWRTDVRDVHQATVSRPSLWLPTWLHLVLVLPTCGAWLIVWGVLRQPTLRRTSLSVTVDGSGRVAVRRIPSS